MEDYMNVVLVVNASDSPASGWPRKQVFPSMSNDDANFWKDVVPEEELNSLWFHTNCVVMSVFDDGKCRNSCKSKLGLEGLMTEVIDVVDPSNNPHDATWPFPFWSETSLEAGILDAQMRSGFDARYDQLDVSYCLAERAPQRCQIGVSNALLLAIVVCVSAKAVNCIFLMAYSVSRQDNHPLVTLGDAVESLLRRPDPTTARMCTLEMRDIYMTWDRLLSRFKRSRNGDYGEAGEGAQLLNGEHSHKHGPDSTWNELENQNQG
ncbi:carbonic anhydrase [Purpureocillium lavendulum]|uniref:Carbonic anhydrase n=1 Tax=Purpureocillium lavendulum TaxID=1247861 RepID=A0AB34FLN4_9HYPO|nr:carbonic anhydrase [Purpureocillium lavendulum]